VLPTVDQQSPELVAEKILSAIASPIAIEDGEIEITASIGMSFFPDQGSDNDSLIGKADSAMYIAKRNGGGVKIYQQEE
jgi:GGDEF domain-containing protein